MVNYYKNSTIAGVPTGVYWPVNVSAPTRAQRRNRLLVMSSILFGRNGLTIARRRARRRGRVSPFYTRDPHPAERPDIIFAPEPDQLNSGQPERSGATQ